GGPKQPLYFPGWGHLWAPLPHHLGDPVPHPFPPKIEQQTCPAGEKEGPQEGRVQRAAQEQGRLFVMNRAILGMGLLLASVGLCPAPSPTPTALVPTFSNSDHYDWVQGENSPTFQSYWAKVPGTDVIAMKGAGLVRQPMEKVASVIVDTTRGTEWIDS